jgi:hypothetical protein
MYNEPFAAFVETDVGLALPEIKDNPFLNRIPADAKIFAKVPLNIATAPMVPPLNPTGL